MALLTKEERESWTGLVEGLAAYYQSPGRLAGLRRRFESAFRQPGLDPATFATDLGMLRRQLDGFAQGTLIGEIVDSCRVWESHSDSNRIPTGNYDSEVGSQSSDSRTWERRKVGVAIEEPEPEAEGQEDRSVLVLLGRLAGMWDQTWEKGPREGNGTPTGGPACMLGENDGPTVDRHPGVGAVHLQQIKTGGPHGDHKQNRVKKKVGNGEGVRETSEGSRGGVSLSDLWRSKLH